MPNFSNKGNPTKPRYFYKCLITFRSTVGSYIKILQIINGYYVTGIEKLNKTCILHANENAKKDGWKLCELLNNLDTVLCWGAGDSCAKSGEK